jgi:hypothetical protein
VLFPHRRQNPFISRRPAVVRDQALAFSTPLHISYLPDQVRLYYFGVIASQLYLYPRLSRLYPRLGPSSVISRRPTSIPPLQVSCANGKSFAHITNASSRRITRAIQLTTSELACARQVSPDHLVNFNGCCHNYICRLLVGTCTRHTSIARFALLALGFIILRFLRILKPCFHSIRPMPPDLDSHP